MRPRSGDEGAETLAETRAVTHVVIHAEVAAVEDLEVVEEDMAVVGMGSSNNSSSLRETLWHDQVATAHWMTACAFSCSWIKTVFIHMPSSLLPLFHPAHTSCASTFSFSLLTSRFRKEGWNSPRLKIAGDGYLDANELPPALYGLLNYDANGDGRISAAEYLGALRQVQLEMSLDQQ